jgi:hypothetical protein
VLPPDRSVVGGEDAVEVSRSPDVGERRHAGNLGSAEDGAAETRKEATVVLKERGEASGDPNRTIFAALMDDGKRAGLSESGM